MKKKHYLTAGEFSKLHHINKRTLQYYDDICLFSPAYKDEKGYRYYTRTQSPAFEIILAFRELGMPIEEIKTQLKESNVDGFIQFFEENKKNIQKKIAQLTSISQSFEARKRLLELSKQPLNRIEIKYLENSYLYCVPCDSKVDFETNFIEFANIYYQNTNDRIFRWPVGGIISLEEATKKTNRTYLYSFIQNDDEKKSNNLFLEGYYLVCNSLGDDYNLALSYTKMLAYANTHHFELATYGYEIGLNDEVYDPSKNDYLIQILIPMKIT